MYDYVKERERLFFYIYIYMYTHIWSNELRYMYIKINSFNTLIYLIFYINFSFVSFHLLIYTIILELLFTLTIS